MRIYFSLPDEVMLLDSLDGMNALHAHFEHQDPARQFLIVASETVVIFEHRLHLYRTFRDPRRRDGLRCGRRQLRNLELVALVAITAS